MGFDALKRVFRKGRHKIDIEALRRIMVFNRLCDPESKLGTLRWLETVSLPKIDSASVAHQHLLRAMDALMDHQDDVDSVVAGLLRPLVDQELSIVFYDMTTIGAAGLSEQTGDLRQYGMSKEGLVKRQVMLGVVQTAEVKTLKPTLEKVLKRFPIKRMIVVADRDLLSTDNWEALQAMRLPCGALLAFILAVPGRRYRDFKDMLQPLHKTYCQDAKTAVVGDTPWQGLRLNKRSLTLKLRRNNGLANLMLRTQATEAVAANAPMVVSPPT